MSIGLQFSFSLIRQRPLITWGIFEDFSTPLPLLTSRKSYLEQFFKTCILGIEVMDLLKKTQLFC